MLLTSIHSSKWKGIHHAFNRTRGSVLLFVFKKKRILIEEIDYDVSGFKGNELKHITSLFKNGQYETIKKLGSGAFGTVFLVIDKLDDNTK